MKCPIYRVQLVRSTSVEYKSHGSINSSDKATSLVAAIAGPILRESAVEQFCVITLDTKLKVIGFHVITSGTLDASLVHPREVFQPAILCNASAIIAVHNHPSGDTTPSRQDHEVTERLKKAGEILGINLIDHFVVGFDGDTTKVTSILY